MKTKVSRKTKSPEKPRAKRGNSAGEEAKNRTAFPIVGIGASAGGLEAFTKLLHNLPEKTGMALVLVQHLDPSHGSVLNEILSRTTKIPVAEVKDGTAVQPDHIYVIPANTSMVIEGGALRLGARTLTRGVHMPIDQFFQSLADERNSQAIGVILSGTASDGTVGCNAIKVAGGITFAQSEDSAKYSSMPHSAIASGSIDFVLEPKDIAKELVRIARHPYIARIPAPKEESGVITAGADMDRLLSMVREATGVDFNLYKATTLQRRIKRRMVLHRLERVKDYLRYIQAHPGELDELYRDLLIHVTGFFRDKDAFEALRLHVFPNLFHDRKLDESPVRIWVPGCSTGEEAYSIAIVLLEYMWEKAHTTAPGILSAKAVQIFATDISENSLDRARMGLYSEAAVAEVSPERLSRFFLRLDGGYQINKSVREMVIFARQNVTKDPPFSNLDLISCRNLLIYLGPVLQKRVIPTLHYSLKSNGYLMLGGSESLGTFTDHFTLIDKKHKIYQKKKTSTRLITYFTGESYAPQRLEETKAKASPAGFTIEKEVDRVLTNRYLPASIVVNDVMEIVQFRGHTGAYLEPAAGHPTFSLSKMAREGLLVDLRSAISKAKKDNQPVRVERVHVKSNGGTREVDLEVLPIRGPGSAERFFVVVFEESSRVGHDVRAKRERAAPKQRPSTPENERLRRELQQLRDQLQSLVEEHETTAEEYKSANEEVLSANEELQSTNEELETAKEELQSSNEELTTLNEELQNRNIELSLANNDLINLLGNVNTPVVMVGNDLRIRRFTPPAEKLMNLIPSDIGRRLGEIRPNLNVENLEHIIDRAIESTTLQEQEIQDKDGTWHLMRVRPYKTAESKLDGVVISFQDIDALKRTLQQIRIHADTLIQNAKEPILLLDGSLNVAAANPAFYRAFQATPEATQGRAISELGNRQWNIPRLRQLLQQVRNSDTRIDDFEVRHDFPNLGNRTMLLHARRIEAPPGQPLIYLSIEDVTEVRNQMEELSRQAALLDLAHEAVIVRDMQGNIQLWNHGAEEMYGWKKQEAIGRTTNEILRTQFPQPFNEIETELLRTGHWQGELVHTRRDGERRVVSSRWALLKADQNGPVAIEINTDITEKRGTEESLRQLSAYLMRVQDEERRRIARELHDSTGQKLVALKMGLEAAAAQAGQKSGRQGDLAEPVKLANEALQEIRNLAQLLHPPVLDEAGLVSATQWMVDGFSNRSGIKVKLDVSPQLGRLPQNLEIALFRIIQESLSNVHKHSQAKKATIELKSDADKVTLQISDDGRGMPQEVLAPSSEEKTPLGVGILGMRERLSQLGGTLEISSGKKGTRIKAVVPNHHGSS